METHSRLQGPNQLALSISTHAQGALGDSTSRLQQLTTELNVAVQNGIHLSALLEASQTERARESEASKSRIDSLTAQVRSLEKECSTLEGTVRSIVRTTVCKYVVICPCCVHFTLYYFVASQLIGLREADSSGHWRTHATDVVKDGLIGHLRNNSSSPALSQQRGGDEGRSTPQQQDERSTHQEQSAAASGSHIPTPPQQPIAMQPGAWPMQMMPGMQMPGMQMPGTQMPGMQMPGMQSMQMPGMMPGMQMQQPK